MAGLSTKTRVECVVVRIEMRAPRLAHRFEAGRVLGIQRLQLGLKDRREVVAVLHRPMQAFARLPLHRVVVALLVRLEQIAPPPDGALEGFHGQGAPLLVPVFPREDDGLPRDEAVDRMIEEAGLTSLEYSTRWNTYRLSLSPDDVASKSQVINNLIGLAHRNRAQ